GVNIDASALYSFVTLPQQINPIFLGIDLSKPNMILAVIAAIAQYYQAKTAMPTTAPSAGKKDQATQFSETMMKQMVFIVPVITLFILGTLPSALGLYWIITTIFTIIQQRAVFNKKSHD
ncbi:MAG: YidC/Oxa1 family membrane protein insertase, partial [Candidatus Pacebacteria bacterium]|nr:YidC/Oxa1 family membrane protein insertase [Candidatus Paceibacterota bacterium]